MAPEPTRASPIRVSDAAWEHLTKLHGHLNGLDTALVSLAVLREQAAAALRAKSHELGLPTTGRLTRDPTGHVVATPDESPSVAEQIVRALSAAVAVIRPRGSQN